MASNYLQTKGLNFHRALHIINSEKINIKSMFNQYNFIIDSARKFVNNIDAKIIMKHDISVVTEFFIARLRKKKNMPRELCHDEISVIHEMGGMKKFEVKMFQNNN